MLLSGKIVLITGASRGIGAALAESCRRRGALLSLTARSPILLPEEAAPDAVVTLGDLTDPSVREAVVERTLERYRRIDILVNNAGFGIYRPAASTPSEETRRLFELNFFAPLALIQLVLPHMLARGSGNIVNISSVAAAVPLPWMPVYSASKAALASLTDCLRMELAETPVRVTLVYPGYVRTPFHDHALGTPPASLARAKRWALSPERAGEAIARALEREADTAVVPPSGWLAVGLARLVPAMVRSALARKARPR